MAQDIVRFDSLSDLLSTPQAAKFTGISENTLRRYGRDGTIPVYRMGKRFLRFRRSDLLQLVSRSDQSA